MSKDLTYKPVKKASNALDKGPKALTASQMKQLKETVEKARKQAKPKDGGCFIEYVG